MAPETAGLSEDNSNTVLPEAAGATGGGDSELAPVIRIHPEVDTPTDVGSQESSDAMAIEYLIELF